MAIDPRRLEEAGTAAATFHVAMAMLGAEALGEVWDEWQAVIPTSTRLEASAAKFWIEAMAKVRFRRHQVQAIVVPFLRLYRALVTGYTFQPVFDPEPAQIRLSKLRDDFTQAVARYAPEALQSSDIHDHTPEDGVNDETTITNPDDSPYKPYSKTSYTDDDEVGRDVIDKLQEILDAEEARADAEAAAILKNLGELRLREKLARLEEEELSAQAADQRQEAEHTKVGRGVAAHAERIAQNGGRHALTVIGRADPRCIGFVRVHFPEKDPQPCGFCALLISRGIAFRPYNSEASAETTKLWSKARAKWGEEMEQYHPECHCHALPVYSQEEFDENPTFDINRAMKNLYDDEFVDMTQWRALMRSRGAQAAPGQE